MRVNSKLLIVGTVLFFIIGDLVTTIYALKYIPGITESNPVVRVFLKQFSLLYLIPYKVIVFGGFMWMYNKIPKPHNQGILMGLMGLGVVITIHNLVLIAKIV